MKEIALIGSPNCGKTTLFNRLTGTRQRTGNWPGVTVERKDGRLPLPSGNSVQVVDLPGIYSLHDDIQGIEARVAHTYVQSNSPALVMVVLDATRLARQLSLLPDIIATGKPVVLVVNMLDSAEAEGIHVDLDCLRRETGLPVAGVVSSTGEGVDKLKTLIDELLISYPAGRLDFDIAELGKKVYRETGKQSRTEKIDRWLLHPIYALPIFLFVMYMLFTIAVNLGAVFIDFFDIILGSVFVDGTRWATAALGAPEWLQAVLADGIGGGIQLVGTFIPVIGCLYLCMSALEDSGYLSRAAFVIDRLMAKIGLPGQAFIPLIIGFGCNVPAVMASRALGQASARLTTIFIAPFMSCGARLSVYVFVGTAFFPSQAQNAIFALYLLGIGVAVLSAWILRRKLFGGMVGANIAEMPAYHRPLIRNVLTQTWHRLYSFIWRAGKRILAVVLILNVFSSMGTDGSWGNQDTEKSMLSATGKVLTPMFTPMGVGENNWPATVGLFTGLFAKEVVVGTLDTLYTPPEVIAEGDEIEAPDVLGDTLSAFAAVWNNLTGLAGALTDPLGISSAQEDIASEQPGSYQAMKNLFPSAWGAFCYLVFILLYAPCVATIGVMQKEAGQVWLGFSVVWSLLLSYWLASNLWHLSLLVSAPLSASLWIIGSSLVLYICYRLIMAQMKRGIKDHIPAVNL
ncbi:ferrous iron transport protein B [Saccharophagus degradans]|uniref:Ferrous iron transport protein B n=1 Tax=Saccharophagus degradans TaxID=86304 RepID=A0AAW7XBS1_9GAMM|nr:ferrous iron transport protein B [Saccharophagus degradans]MBU2986323.1 ferrous iron transport protein B [Saccharophagus degradans]MDO6424366.1 ferrous iron transport protein B [Saccharophagus degradans]MDO6608427.1 ferrous iron transport protein B [Saccharophagus degradans]